MVLTMKTFFLIASLTFASGIMFVPKNVNETHIMINNDIVPSNSSDNTNISIDLPKVTNDINTKHRPYLANVENKNENKNKNKNDTKNRKLLISIEKIVDKNLLSSAPAPVSNYENVKIFMTCDNEFNIFVNGNKIGSGDTWTRTYEFNTLIQPGDVIAIDGIDKGGPAAFIGVFNDKITKPNEWKCSTKKINNWNKNNFDDSSWSYATSYGKNNGQNIWMSVGRGPRPNIPANAEWLWTNNNNDHDRVFCRFFYNGKPSITPTQNPAPKSATTTTTTSAKVLVNLNPTVQSASQSDPKSQTTLSPPELPVSVEPTLQQQVVIPVATSSSSSFSSLSSSSLSSASSSSLLPSHHSSYLDKDCKPVDYPSTSNEVIKGQVSELSNEAKKKMDELSFKFNNMMADIKTKQLKQLEEDGKLLNETEIKSFNINEKYKIEFTNTENLINKINILNITLNNHLKVIQEESDYLSKLKLFKPKFLLSLDNLKEHTGSIKEDIHQTIVEGEDKNSLISILDDIRSSTEKSASLLAKAFMDHYDKYNKQLEQNNDKYIDEQNTMSDLNLQYNIAKTKQNDLLKDYNEIISISKKLKETYLISKQDEAIFNDFMSKIENLFKKNEDNIIIGYKELSTSNTACATDVLKAHMNTNNI